MQGKVALVNGVETAKEIGVDAYFEKSQAFKTLPKMSEAAWRCEHLFVLA
jgi:hypothetical protein